MFSGEVRTRQRLELPEGRVGKVMGVQVFRDGQWGRAEAAGAGQVARLLGLGEVRVGDGFGTSSRAEDHHFPPPTLESSVRACDPAQEPALRAALAQLADQDPLIAARTDEDGHATVSLYGRVQQEVIASTLADEHGIEVEFSEASVLHVERLRRAGTAVERFNTPTNPYGATIGIRLPRGPGHGSRLRPRTSRCATCPSSSSRQWSTSASVMDRHVRQRSRAGPVGLGGDRLPGDADRDGLRARGTARPRSAARCRRRSTIRLLTPIVVRQALARATTQVCEPVLRVALEVPTQDGPQLLRLLGRWGTEVTGQTATADLTRLDARLVAARLHDLQHQLPDLTGGEGVLEATFDGYQPVRGRPPTRRV